MHKEQLQHLSKLLDELKGKKPLVYKQAEKSIQRIINMVMRKL